MTRPPAAQRVGGVLLQGDALLDARRLLMLGVKVMSRRDGISPHPALVGLLQLVNAAADEYQRGMSPSVSSDVPDPGETSESVLDLLARPVLTTREAADVLQISPRQMRRLDGLGVSSSGPKLLFDREKVEAYAAARRRGR